MAKWLRSWAIIRTSHPCYPCTHQNSSRTTNSRFLRWKAIQDAAFVDPADGQEKIWSESNVSEDFDMALRLLLKGYIIRCVLLAVTVVHSSGSLTVGR